MGIWREDLPATAQLATSDAEAPVDISTATPPETGQALVATSATTASWQDLVSLTETSPVPVNAFGAVVGVSTEAAKGDHKHSVNTGSPTDLIVGGQNSAGTSSYLSRADHVHGLPAFGSSAGTFTQGNDARLSNARTPTAHALSHQDAGSDEINVQGLSGTLADPQIADRIKTTVGSVAISGTAPSAGQILQASSSTAASWVGQLVLPSTNSFRLTSTSGSPIETSGGSFSTIYMTPFKGARISLYNGSSWDSVLSGEVSIAVTGRTTDLPFDIFAYNNAGVVTLEMLNWTNATTRATALVRQDGVWSKSGQLTRRYLGSCRPRSATTYSWNPRVIAASQARFDLFNADNRVTHGWSISPSAASWTYTTATWRQAQAANTNQVEVIAGLSEETLVAEVQSLCGNALTGVTRAVAIADDGTMPSGNCVYTPAYPSNINNDYVPVFAKLSAIVPLGRHFYAWVEYSAASGTTTWFGKSATTPPVGQQGMFGFWTC